METLPILFADGQAVDFMGGVNDFLRVVQTHWAFCVLHFLEFAIWGAWYVLLGNYLGARGFSRVEIGRIYGTIPLGAIISPFFIGVLADRNVDGRDMVRYPFLGAQAAFPQGPFRVAMLMQRPVVMMTGIYRGGRRYEVHFELLAEASEARPRLRRCGG